MHSSPVYVLVAGGSVRQPNARAVYIPQSGTKNLASSKENAPKNRSKARQQRNNPKLLPSSADRSWSVGWICNCGGCVKVHEASLHDRLSVSLFKPVTTKQISKVRKTVHVVFKYLSGSLLKKADPLIFRYKTTVIVIVFLCVPDFLMKMETGHHCQSAQKRKTTCLTSPTYPAPVVQSSYIKDDT